MPATGFLYLEQSQEPVSVSEEWKTLEDDTG